ncbi:MAG: hypothetical protein EOO77_06365 [Oxalobacteraceae bacterium]|nr:MAG: hypothetical protein EOO77_06365 [Oxalobacteraceae bacterium]
MNDRRLNASPDPKAAAPHSFPSGHPVVAEGRTYATFDNQHLCDEPMSAPAHTRTLRLTILDPDTGHSLSATFFAGPR